MEIRWIEGRGEGLLWFVKSRDKIPCTVNDGKYFYIIGILGNSVDDSVVVKKEFSQFEIFHLRHNPAQTRHSAKRSN